MRNLACQNDPTVNLPKGDLKYWWGHAELPVRLLRLPDSSNGNIEVSHMVKNIHTRMPTT
jgi:hypothetical protein